MRVPVSLRALAVAAALFASGVCRADEPENLGTVLKGGVQTNVPAAPAPVLKGGVSNGPATAPPLTGGAQGNPNCPPPFPGATRWSCTTGTQTGGVNQRGIPRDQQNGGNVWCQDWPGQPQRGPWKGTGPQTPCGLRGQGQQGQDQQQDPRQNQPPRPTQQTNGCWRKLAPGKLCTDGQWFRNEKGEFVILRGVNVGGGSKVPPFLPLPRKEASAVDKKNFDYLGYDYVANTDLSLLDPLPEWGVNVLRLIFIWEAWEPKQDEYNATYIPMLQRIVNEAWKRGIYTIIDFHQDAFSRFTDQGCGDGFPLWFVRLALPVATLDEPDNEVGKCKPWMQMAMLDWKVALAFNALYNTDLKNRYIAMAKKVASQFTMSGAIGFDLINEPFSKLDGPLVSLDLLGLDQDTIFKERELSGFYRALAGPVRQAAPGAILFLEPNLKVDTGIETDLQAPCSNCNVAYAPHYYDFSAMFGLRVPFTKIDISGVGYVPGRVTPAFDNMANHAAKWKAPFFLGEFGAIEGTARVDAYIRDVHQELNRTFASAAQWAYSPNWTKAGKDGWNGEDLSIVDDSRGWQKRSDLFYPRPYAQRVGGTPQDMAMVSKSFGKFDFRLSWTVDGPGGAETVIYLPQTAAVRAAASPVTTASTMPGPGLWYLGPTECAYRTDKDGIVRVHCTAKSDTGGAPSWVAEVEVQFQ